MGLIIFFKKIGEVELQLKRGRVLIDTLTFGFEANLDTMLIGAVDKILKRNRIGTLSLKTIEVGGQVDQNSSAQKIAQTFIEAWKSAKKVGKR